MKNQAQTYNYWQSVCVAGAQVSFGVIAATWFVPAYDPNKTVVLLVNLILTGIFLLFGVIFAKKK